MAPQRPLIVAILQADGDDVDHQLYSQAYGLEMQIDDEWNVEVVLLAPHDHLAAITEETEVTGEDVGIVSAGVTDVPFSNDGTPNLDVIRDSRNNWLLIGDPRREERAASADGKLRAALDAGCRPIFCLDGTTEEEIAARLDAFRSLACSRVVFALVHPDAAVPEIASSAAQHVREHLASVGAEGRPRLIIGGAISPDNPRELIALDGIDGLLLTDDRYEEFSDILEMVELLGR